MLSCGVGKVLPGPTVGAKCSYPTYGGRQMSLPNLRGDRSWWYWRQPNWRRRTKWDINNNRVEDVKPNGDPPAKDSTLKSVRIQKGIFW